MPDIFDLIKLEEKGAAPVRPGDPSDIFTTLDIPVGGGRVAGGVVPRQVVDPIVEAINVLPTEAGLALGKQVQSAVEPFVGGTGADIAGALTKATTETLAPGALISRGQRTVQGLLKAGPTSRAIQQEAAILKGQKLMGQRVPGTAMAAEEAMQRFRALPPERIPMSNTESALDNLIGRLEDMPKGEGATGFLKYARDLQKRIKGKGHAADIKWIDAVRSDVGELTKVLKGGQGHPGYSQLYAALGKDLESMETGLATNITQRPGFSFISPGAPPEEKVVEQVVGTRAAGGATGPPLPVTQQVTVPGAAPKSVTTTVQPYLEHRPPELLTPSGAGKVALEKSAAFRQSRAWEEIGDEFNKTIKKGPRGRLEVQGNVLDRIDKEHREFLRQSMPANEWKDVEAIFNRIEELTKETGRVRLPFPVSQFTRLVSYPGRKLLETAWGRKAVRNVLEAPVIDPVSFANLNKLAQLATGELPTKGPQ